jgi:hypothetical protein
MRNLSLLLLLIGVVYGCGPSEKLDDTQESSTEYILTNDTIPDVRETISKQPVATYSTVVKEDELNDFKFAVNVFETPETFTYLMKVRYKSLDVQDTIRVPKEGIYPKIELQKGENDLSCIIGFIDKKEVFRPHKMVHVVDDKLRIKVLQQYRTGIYQKAK